jgi:hypothetical protein
MKYRVTKIDWDTTDEDRDDNGLPVTAKDLGLPAYDESVEVECDSVEDIADALSDEYGFCVNSFSVENSDADKAKSAENDLPPRRPLFKRKGKEKTAEQKVKAIKAVINRYFECDPWTGKKNRNYDEYLDSCDAIDEIVQILA